MLIRLLVLLLTIGCSVDRSPAFISGSGAIGAGEGGSGSGGSGAVGGLGGTGGVSGSSGDGGVGVSGSSGDGGVGGVGGPGSVCPNGCDDGVYCNGVESCGPNGCVPGTAPCTTSCDEATRVCSAACIVGFESCNGVDDDCNGRVDDGFGAVCILPNASLALCLAATCVVTSCSTGFLNCDGNASNGCETFADPTPNDCQATTCGGGVVAAPDDTPIDDGNDCTIERCNGSTPEVADARRGDPCDNDSGTCDKGVCKY